MKRALAPLFLLFLTLQSSEVFALLEINGEYGVSTQKYGENRNNKIEATTIGGSVALYLWDLTAIELNYSQTETINSQNNVLSIDGTFDLIGQRNSVLVYNYGIGIRQALASRKARFRPSLSFGYARQFFRDTTQATFRNNSTGSTFIVNDDVVKTREDSVFGSFNLELRLTRTFSLRGSVRTIFEAFEFDRAQDNVQYTLGFAWFL